MKWFSRKKETEQITAEDLQVLQQMLYRYINRDQPINKLVNMTDFITLGYMYNPTVFTVISWRAAAAKGIPWLVYKVTNKQKHRQYARMMHKELNIRKALKLKEQSLEEIENHPINVLLKRPNSHQAFADLIEGMFTYRDIVGNSYLYGATASGKEIASLHMLPGDQTKIIAGSHMDPIKGYHFGGVYDGILEPEKVMHWKYFNPYWKPDGSWLYGMSPLVAAARVINNDNAGIDNQTSSFANEGVKGIVHGKNTQGVDYSPEQIENIFKKWKRWTKRAQNGEGSVGFSNQELGFIKVGETPVDLGVMESRKFNKEILCNIFRIHPSLLSSDASTLNNLTEARKALITISVLPDMDSFRDNLNGQLQRIYGEQYYVDYDLMAISELQDDLHKLAATLNTMSWVTENEKRVATDYDEYPNDLANVLYTDMGKLPMGSAIDTGFDEIDKRLKKLKDANLAAN